MIQISNIVRVLTTAIFLQLTLVACSSQLGRVSHFSGETIPAPIHESFATVPPVPDPVVVSSLDAEKSPALKLDAELSSAAVSEADVMHPQDIASSTQLLAQVDTDAANIDTPAEMAAESEVESEVESAAEPAVGVSAATELTDDSAADSGADSIDSVEENIEGAVSEAAISDDPVSEDAVLDEAIDETEVEGLVQLALPEDAEVSVGQEEGTESDVATYLLDEAENSLDRDNHERARGQAERALAVEPTAARAYLILARVEYAEGHPEQAAELARQGLESSSDSDEIFGKLNQILSEISESQNQSEGPESESMEDETAEDETAEDETVQVPTQSQDASPST